MDVNLLFKIAAVGILVTVIGQVLKGGACIFGQSCRSDHSIVLDRALYIRFV